LAASEYIRLVGFGNAIGHLVYLNLPGFEAIKQQAIDVDELISRNRNQTKTNSGVALSSGEGSHRSQ
jgi:hypothetical protein